MLFAQLKCAVRSGSSALEQSATLGVEGVTAESSKCFLLVMHCTPAGVLVLAASPVRFS